MALRINAALARCGVASRRQADRLIGEGLILVDSRPALLGETFDPSKQRLWRVEGQKARLIDLGALGRKARLWIHNKPAGVLVSASDLEDRTCLMPALQSQLGLDHLVPVGRLDLQTEGLLLVTDSGKLAHAIFGDRNLERIYHVRVRGKVNEEKLKSLAEGVTVRGVRYAGCKGRLLRSDGEQTGSNAWIELTLREGKNREVRNLMTSIGLTVNRLVRVAFGPYRLPRTLTSGDTMAVDNLFKRLRKD